MIACAKPTVNSDSIPSDKDILWIPREDAKYGLSKALQAQALEDKLAAKEKDIQALNERIGGLKQIISTMQAKDDLSKSVVKSFEREIKELKDIRKLQELDVLLYKKQIRKLKRGKFWTAIGGTAGIVGAFWLGTQF